VLGVLAALLVAELVRQLVVQRDQPRPAHHQKARGALVRSTHKLQKESLRDP
jgi:hypothetical protein